VLDLPDSNEWLEADGLGGFACGTATGIRTRRYHALLQVATTPPTGRMVLVDGFEAWLERDGTRIALSSQRYAPGVVFPDGSSRISGFAYDPWPRWTYRADAETEVELELFVPYEQAAVALRWRLRSTGRSDPKSTARLIVRPLLSGRDHHSLHHENSAIRFDADVSGSVVRWQPYFGVAAVLSYANATYTPAPEWYRNFLLTEEQSRGLDSTADLASPGELTWDLQQGDAVWILAAEGLATLPLAEESPTAVYDRLRMAEQNRRGSFASPLDRAADSYLVRRGDGKTIIAGYPWFTDWGRDTLIGLRGLCLATGRLKEARAILLEWSAAVDRGMLPNRFVDHGTQAEFNSVDAALWFVIAVHDFIQAMARNGRRVVNSDRARLDSAVEAILSYYALGTRYGIYADDDGLLYAGKPGVQLTWMDAKVGDWVVTPRIGKPVEIQALWLNALRIAGDRSPRWKALFERGRESFIVRFWNPAGYLYDVVDVNNEPGTADATFRPNQIFAVGGLPYPLIDGAMARSVVESVESRLLTPLGLRSLAPGEPGYAGHYQGGVLERDGSYHQGTVWPWLLGPFVEAWLRVQGNTKETCHLARDRFLTPLYRHLSDAGLGHISEITDAEPPFTPRGCPFQAWSLGELLRLDRLVLVPQKPARPERQRVAHVA
jgi:predicted glycogen debranching enzyme